MSKKVLLALVAVVACVATVGSAQAPSDVQAPLLFVSKTTSSGDLIIGASVEITVAVTNYGQSPAFDVVVSDEVEGGKKQDRTFASIPYGATEVIRYTVTPKAVGQFPVGVATVTYNLEQGDAATARTAQSSIIREETAYYRGEDKDDVSFRGSVSVLTRERYDRLHATHIKETIAYVFLGLLPAAFPYLLYRTKQTQVDELLKPAKSAKGRKHSV